MQHLSEILKKSSKYFPHNIALENPGIGQMTYQSLAEKTSLLQKELSQIGIGEGKIVGILQEKSIESVIFILGILSAEAAYVPVDFLAPLSRNIYIFNDCSVDALLIAKDQVANFVEAYPVECSVHDIQGFSMQLVIPKYSSQEDLSKPTLPKDLAYILYTSGSTGNPKGVMITHINALKFIEWSLDKFNLSDKDILTSIAPFHFDLSIFDIYVSLLSGAKLVLIDQKAGKNPRLISQLIQENKISIIYATPTFLRLVLQYGKPERFDHSSIRLVLFAGEVFPIVHLRKLKDLWDHAQFYNLYGPTETNVVTWHEVPNRIPEHQNFPLPIGRACPFTICKLWNEGVTEPAAGLRGELIVSGDNLAMGYLNLPAKTNDSFFVHGNDRWYKTGDLVEVNDNLEFVFVGRLDRMVKRKGYRIELAEIESALSLHPEISENGVVASNEDEGEIVIKAYIRTRNPEIELTAFQLKQFCVSNLPGYMIPDKFSFHGDLPKTSTHKIDYQKLQQL